MKKLKWHKFRILHSQKNLIELFCRQSGKKIEVFITDGKEKDPRILEHDFLLGNLSDLFLDQNCNSIDWEISSQDFSYYISDSDMAAARIRNKQNDSLNFLRYHLANAINTTFSNRSFSRYLKKNIVGKWKEKEITLEFYDDETYVFKGKWKPSTTLAGIPKKGKYFFHRNMILFWGPEDSGIRSQIVDLVDNKLLFPGYDGKLFFIMKRE